MSVATRDRAVAGPALLSPEVWLALACFVGSAATVQKYAGTAATVAYLVALLVAVPLFVRRVLPRLPRLSPRTLTALALGTLLVLLVLYAVIYPHANTHAPNAGSDRDDAADLGAHALLHGQWPYHGHTYLGNSISQFPGLLLLAVPFVWLGHSAYAAFFWLPVLYLLLRKLSSEPRTPLVLLWLALVASPVLVREVVTGGDLIANSVSVMLATWLLLLALERRGPLLVVLAGLALGFTLSSRLNFFFVLPPLFVAVWRRFGARAAVASGLLAVAGFAAVTLPFYVGHGGHFPPLEASDHLAAFNGSVPGGERLVIAAGFVLSGGLALRMLSTSVKSVFAQVAVVQSFFLVAVVVLASARAGSLDLASLTPGYGLPVVLFALGAIPLGQVA